METRDNVREPLPLLTRHIHWYMPTARCLGAEQAPRLRLLSNNACYGKKTDDHRARTKEGSAEKEREK